MLKEALRAGLKADCQGWPQDGADRFVAALGSGDRVCGPLGPAPRVPGPVPYE